MSALKVFWYRAEANFGDALSALVAEQVSGRAVEWAARDRADLFGLGSLMTMVANGHGGPRLPKPVVWGTGCMGPVSRDFLEHVEVVAVRGPRTAEILGLSGVPYGDPGVFAADVVGTLPVREDRVGVVPHLTMRTHPGLLAAVEADPRLTLIDPATSDAAAVVRQIAGCAYILSSSLHGLVVADACGVPNRWIDPDGIHGHARLKFFDYAESVGRDLGAPVPPEAIGEALAGPLPEWISYGAGVTESRMRLAESFPDALRTAARAA